MSADIIAPRTSLLHVLSHRPFRRFFASRFISLAGDAVVPTALTLSLIEGGWSTSWLAVILSAALLPKLVFLSFGGIVADLWPQQPLLIATSLLCAGTQLASAILLITHSSPWWVLACQACYGAATAVALPATFGYLVKCARPEQLGSANALLGAASGAASLLGPAVTGLLTLLGPAPLGLAADGLSFLLSTLLLIGLPRGDPVGGTGSRAPGLSALREGWHALRRIPWLLSITLASSSITMMVTAPFMVLAPTLVQRMEPRGWTVLMVVFAVGELLGSAAAGRRPPARPMLWSAVSLLVLCLPPLALTVNAGLVALCGAQFAAGLGVGAYLVLTSTAIQHAAAPEQLSRVGALSSVTSLVFKPLGYVLAPVLSAAIGTHGVLLTAVVWAVIVVAVLLTRPAIRAHRSPLGVPELRTGRRTA